MDKKKPTPPRKPARILPTRKLTKADLADVTGGMLRVPTPGCCTQGCCE